MLGLTYLDARQRGIVDLIGLEHATNLTSLDLHNNEISNLSELSEMTMLTTLLLHRNQISDLWPLSNLTNLTTITLQHNQITDTSALLALTDLKFLSLEFNQIDNLSGLSEMTMLTTLPLHRNQISDLWPLAKLTNLTSITLQHNQISDISPLSAMNSLTSLNLYSNPLDCPAHDIYIPMIETNNPGINLTCDPRPEYCDYQPEQILEFFDTSVADGTLEGVGPGNSPDNRLKALRNMLEATSDLIVGEYYDDAYAQLVNILKKCDGQFPPPDFVTGEAREELANMIMELMEDLEVE
jgi:Leucine-rich repeat (LRR) protein